MQLLKQSTAATTVVGPILDSTGAEYTGAVIGDMTITKNGTSSAMAAAATLTHIANGHYTLVFTTGNTDTVGRLTIHCNKSTYQMPPRHFTVLLATVYDALITNDAGGANGLLLSLASNQVDVGKMLGSATPVTNLNTIYNTDYATVYDATNKAFLSKLGNFAMGGSSLALTTGAISCTTITASGAVAFQSTFGITGAATFTGAITGTNASNDLRINGVVPGAAGGVFIAGTNAATTITTALTTTFTGSLTGNVNGNVGGNVTGSVGSVVGAVGSVGSGGITTGSFAAGAINAAAIADGAIDRATFAADTGLQTVRSNTAQTGGSSTITLDSGASSTDMIYEDCLIYLTGGTGAGQCRWIVNYSGTSKIATVGSAWFTNPDNTTTFAILPSDSVFHQLSINHLESGSLGAVISSINALVAASAIRSAVGLSSANLDTQLSTIASYVDTEVAAIKAKTDQLTFTVANQVDSNALTVHSSTKTGYALSATGTDLVLIDGKTLPAALQIIASSVIGKVSGAGTGVEVFKGLDGSTTRATVTVDASGNRTAIVYV